MVQVSTLRNIAINGAVLSISAACFFYYKIQSGLADGVIYKRSVAALKSDERLRRALGPPVRTLFLNLGNGDNFVTHNRVQLSIPVKGSKYKGHLHTQGRRCEETNKWMIETLTLEVNQKSVPVPFTNNTCDMEVIREKYLET